MIKLEFTPATCPFGDDPDLLEVKMTLGHDISWSDATNEFHNFLRAAGYKIPYSPVNIHPVMKAWNEAQT
jgi:hypothetical protein